MPAFIHCISDTRDAQPLGGEAEEATLAETAGDEAAFSLHFRSRVPARSSTYAINRISRVSKITKRKEEEVTLIQCLSVFQHMSKKQIAKPF